MDSFVNFIENAKRPDNTVYVVKDKYTVLVIDTNLQVWLIRVWGWKGKLFLLHAIDDN